MSIARTILLLAGLALVVFLLIRLDPAELLSLLLGMGWTVLIFPPLYAAHQAVRTAALAAALEHAGTVSFGRLLMVRLAGEAVQYLTFTGPLLAEPTKALMLRREGLESTDAVSATITEYVTFTGTAFVVSFIGLAALRLTVPMPFALRASVTGTAIGMFLLLVVGVLALRRRWPIAGWTLARLRRLPPLARRLTVAPEWVREMEGHVFRNLHDDPPRRNRILALQAVAQALLVLELYLLLRVFAGPVGVFTVFIVEGANKVSNFLFFFVPARAGTDEAMLVLVTGALGIASVVGMGVSLVRRARSLVTGVIGLAAAWLLSGGRQVDAGRDE